MISLGYLRHLALAVALSVVGASQASAQQPASSARPAPLTRLLDCRAIQGTGARLACFDAAAAAFDSAEREGEVVVVDRAQVTAERRLRFGFDMPSMPSLFDRGPSDRIDAIETTLTRANRDGSGQWTFVLADGSVWRQSDGGPLEFRNRPGQPVRVRSAAMGSFMLTVDRSRAVRVRRQAP